MSSDTKPSPAPSSSESSRFLRILQSMRLPVKTTSRLYVVIIFSAIVVLVPYIVLLLNWLGGTSPTYDRNKGLGIQELITDVKGELIKTEEARRQKGEAALFELRDFDLEISFVVRASTKQRGGANYEVLTVDSEVQTGSERIQKLTLHMTAVPQQSKPEVVEPSPLPLHPSQGDIETLTPKPPKRGDHQ